MPPRDIKEEQPDNMMIDRKSLSTEQIRKEEHTDNKIATLTKHKITHEMKEKGDGTGKLFKASEVLRRTKKATPPCGWAPLKNPEEETRGSHNSAAYNKEDKGRITDIFPFRVKRGGAFLPHIILVWLSGCCFPVPVFLNRNQDSGFNTLTGEGGIEMGRKRRLRKTEQKTEGGM